MSTTVHQPQRRAPRSSRRPEPPARGDRTAEAPRPQGGALDTRQPAARQVAADARRRARAQALVAFGQTVPLVIAGTLIVGYVIWISLEMGARVEKGDALLAAILAGCVIGALAAGIGAGARGRNRR
jgi:hypothetical protein